ncbi:hypothetical protein EGM51_14140 [Verrucomicrobia bacterium S94]|nr:hypothetical protein EGM51_14140 [Verrucomicrobia bacterium S94]
MPNRNGTGPNGEGPMTGRGAGNCTNNGAARGQQTTRLGRAMRRGNRCGGGRGMGMRGNGRNGAGQ